MGMVLIVYVLIALLVPIICDIDVALAFAIVVTGLSMFPNVDMNLPPIINAVRTSFAFLLP